MATACKNDDVLFMVESPETFAKLAYHQQRIVLLLSAGRHYANEKRRGGWCVDYHSLEDGKTWEQALAAHVNEHMPHSIIMAQPNNYDEQKRAELLSTRFPIEILPTQQFLVPRRDFSAWAAGRKSLLMEAHYRRVRKKFGFLMEPDGQPVGGRWNYDEANRKTFRDWQKAGCPRAQITPVGQDTITSEVISLVGSKFGRNPGNAADFCLPVDRAGALCWLDDFVANRLAEFGPWEDLMVQDDHLLFHSLISPLINLGLLTPGECIEKAIAAYEKNKAPLASVEGFVRQIAGWREFVNGVYWLKMPEYAEANSLGAERGLPDFFYTAETDLNCLRQTIEQVRATGFNHHIQRLMVLGNFLLLTGVNPQKALRWFLEMYIDAHDWVMAANVLGMVLHADDGLTATKPYAAGSAYISRMSNYCAGCHYKPELKTGPEACPFNYLYWNFYAQHEKRFAKNPRIAMTLRMLKKKPHKERREIQESADHFFESRMRSQGG